jgi:hypothetical protein
MRPLLVVFVALTTVAGSTTIATAGPSTLAVPFEVQSLDGGGNNVANPTWGQANTPYSRVATARYADGRSQPVAGPNSRFVSNRVFNDVAQNVFSERQVTAWGWAWGQFLDHTFGLRLGRAPGDPAGETANIPFDSGDPLEEFANTLGHIPFARSDPVPGTGVTNPRQQVNTNSSYIDAFAVYGGTNSRLDWLREGSVDGNPANNNGRLLMQDNYLPRATARGDAASAPAMEIDGILRANPGNAMVAGDVRANENLFLTATHTLFAREHNRIVAQLPASLSEEDKFQIARRIVIAEQQYVTYNEWLPAMGVSLPAYSGYNVGVNPALSNEFATVGYRVHSQIHGEMEIAADASRYTPAQLAAFEAQGIEILQEEDEVELVIPLNRGFFNPDLVPAIGLGPLLSGVGNDPALTTIRNTYGIDFRRSLGDLIALNSDVPRADLPGNVFFAEGNVPPAGCRVTYRVDSQWGSGSGGFGVTMSVTNTGPTPIPAGWTLRFVFANGQQINDDWNGVAAQDGARVPIANAAWNARINPGRTIDGIGFNATWTGTNGRPPAFSVNTTACASG